MWNKNRHNFNVKVKLTSAEAVCSGFLLSEMQNRKDEQEDKYTFNTVMRGISSVLTGVKRGALILFNNGKSRFMVLFSIKYNCY